MIQLTQKYDTDDECCTEGRLVLGDYCCTPNCSLGSAVHPSKYVWCQSAHGTTAEQTGDTAAVSMSRSTILLLLESIVPHQRRPFLPPGACPPCYTPKHPWEIARRRVIHNRRSALRGRSMGVGFTTKPVKVGDCISVRRIRSREDVGCGLEIKQVSRAIILGRRVVL